jgi:type II secretory pathway pseudopilin PulG
MEKGRNKKAFTLVESIVIITILVILVTIGFIAFGKNTQYAKNTKVVSDIENISKKVNIKVVEEK